jgi:hypothetical protein
MGSKLQTQSIAMKDEPTFESAESASPVITRVVAGVLGGRHETVFQFAAWERLGMCLLNLFPPGVAQSVVRWQFNQSALSPERARQLDVNDLVRQRLQDYRELEGRFPVVIVGSALAGAAAHIAAILGGPFLPQPFILGLRGGSPDESVAPHLAQTSSIAEAILERNPSLKAIAHFDPVHDGWLTRTVSHLRLKLIDLPKAYRSFLCRHLTPGGTILYLDCRAEWLQFPLMERFSYQIGGWGGIPAEEYLHGSDRIDQFLKTSGSPHRGGWHVPGIEPVWGSESEWGSEPGLDQALQAFAKEFDYHFQRIQFVHPHEFSRLAFEAHKTLFDQNQRAISGVLIETFTQFDPFIVLQGGLLPLWLVFNTSDCLEFLKNTLKRVPTDVLAYFSGLATLSRTPDMIPWGEWATTLEGRPWVSVGAGPRRYPEDMVALFRWVERIKKHLHLDVAAPLPRLSLKDFLLLLPG